MQEMQLYRLSYWHKSFSNLLMVGLGTEDELSKCKAIYNLTIKFPNDVSQHFFKRFLSMVLFQALLV